MAKPLVSVILPVYNGKNVGVERAITSLLNQDYDNFEIIVIDDLSNDSSYEFIKEKFGQNEKVILIKNEKRASAGGSCNKGIKLAKGEYIFRTDQDMGYDANVLSELIKVIEMNKNIAAAGCKIYYEDSNKIRALGVRVTPFTLKSIIIGRDEIDNGQYDKVMEVDGLIGGNMLLRKSVIDKIGDFEENYILYYSDVDWCLRAKSKGYKVMYTPLSKVTHKREGENNITSFSVYHAMRDKFTFMKIHSKPLFYYAFLLITLGYSVLKSIGFIIGRKGDLAKAQMKGCLLGLKYNETKYNKRSFIDGSKDI